MNNLKIGHWAFIVGLILAVISPFVNIPFTATILFILGLIVGFLNIQERESTGFLVAVIALLAVGVSGLQLGALTAAVAAILEGLIALVSPAALIVGIKQVLAIGRAG